MKPLLLIALLIILSCTSRESKSGGIRPDSVNLVKKDTAGARELPDSAFAP